jgi:RimJ/RimL family protein N-acetyltransferase
MRIAPEAGSIEVGHICWSPARRGTRASSEAIYLFAAWVVQMAGKADPLFFAVIDRERRTPAGVASLMRIAPEAGSIEVGHICWSPALRGTRASSEAIYLFADWVFREGYRRFEWKCDALNRPSRRAAERMGFSYEGVFRQSAVVKGRNRDTAWFAMTDGDWRCLKPAWEAWLEPANFDAEGRQRQALRALTTPCRVASDPL